MPTTCPARATAFGDSRSEVRRPMRLAAGPLVRGPKMERHAGFAPPPVETILAAAEPIILRVCGRRLRGWLSAHRDDVQQECRLRLWRSAPSYDPSKGSIDPWAARIIRNTIIDQVRTIMSEDQAFPLSDDDLPHDDQPDEDEEQAARLN